MYATLWVSEQSRDNLPLAFTSFLSWLCLLSFLNRRDPCRSVGSFSVEEQVWLMQNKSHFSDIMYCVWTQLPFIIKSWVFNTNHLLVVFPAFTSSSHGSWAFSPRCFLEFCTDYIFKQETKQITRSDLPLTARRRAAKSQGTKSSQRTGERTNSSFPPWGTQPHLASDITKVAQNPGREWHSPYIPMSPVGHLNKTR